MPLHPAIVHLPLGLAFVLPLVAAYALYQLTEGRRSGAVLGLALAALLFGATIAARATGEDEEDRVEAVVAEAVLEEHEEAADVFTVGAGVLLVASLASVVLGTRPVARLFGGAVVLAAVIVAGLGVYVGHRGGSIVYEHGGAGAYATRAAPASGARVREDVD